METIDTLLINSPLSRKDCCMVKRFFDIVIALMVLVFIFPIAFICIGTGMKICMPGPIFFKQKRTSRNGKIFYCYKFRSMDARNKADVYTDPDTNHIRFGNFLRKTSLDELPQFWNVLKGDMSVIGPRPHMIVHDQQYEKVIDNYALRYTVKPGITGWAQVNGYRGQSDLTSVQKRIDFDLWYIQHWSLWLDIEIMFRTVLVMVKHG